MSKKMTSTITIATGTHTSPGPLTELPANAKFCVVYRYDTVEPLEDGARHVDVTFGAEFHTMSDIMTHLALQWNMKVPRFTPGTVVPDIDFEEQQDDVQECWQFQADEVIVTLNDDDLWQNRDICLGHPDDHLVDQTVSKKFSDYQCIGTFSLEGGVWSHYSTEPKSHSESDNYNRQECLFGLVVVPRMPAESC